MEKAGLHVSRPVDRPCCILLNSERHKESHGTRSTFISTEYAEVTIAKGPANSAGIDYR